MLDLLPGHLKSHGQEVSFILYIFVVVVLKLVFKTSRSHDRSCDQSFEIQIIKLDFIFFVLFL